MFGLLVVGGSTIRRAVAPGLGLAAAVAALAVGAVGLAPDFLIELAKKATFAIR